MIIQSTLTIHEAETNVQSNAGTLILSIIIIFSSVFNVIFLLSGSRFEEREAELKREFNGLHQRHTEVRFWSFSTIKMSQSNT